MLYSLCAVDAHSSLGQLRSCFLCTARGDVAMQVMHYAWVALPHAVPHVVLLPLGPHICLIIHSWVQLLSGIFLLLMCLAHAVNNTCLGDNTPRIYVQGTLVLPAQNSRVLNWVCVYSAHPKTFKSPEQRQWACLMARGTSLMLICTVFAFKNHIATQSPKIDSKPPSKS